MKAKSNRVLEEIAVIAVAIAGIITLPITVPVVIVLESRFQKKLKNCAEKTDCDQCGKTLGFSAIERARNAHESERLADAIKARKIIKVRAICECGAEYEYDRKRDALFTGATIS